MKYLITLLTLISISNTCIGQCELEAKNITVFKDATVYIEKGGVCDVAEKTILIEMPIQKKVRNETVRSNRTIKYEKNHIILGTLELESPGNEILSSKSVKVFKKNEFSSVHQLFSQNIGKKIKVKVKTVDKEKEGIIFSLERTESYSAEKHLAKVLILKNKEKWLFVNLSEIETFEFIDTPTVFEKSEDKNLLLSLDENVKKQEIKMSYLRKGITWTPNYFLTLEGDNKVKLLLKANIVNDAEDLLNVDLNLAVGIPVFKFSNIGDPLFSNISVVSLMNRLSNLDNKGYNESALYNHSPSVYAERYGDNVEPVLEGEGMDDIYLYKLKNIDLVTEQRSSLDLLEMEGSYENLYVVDLESNEYFTSRNKKKEIGENLVWHSIKFDNTSGKPLTTGTVFFKKSSPEFENKTPLSQGQLNFTPIGKHCIAKMNISPKIIVKDSDIEISREKHKLDSYRYLVQVNGEVEITNFKDEKIRMHINREIRAQKINESNTEFKILRTKRKLNEINQINFVQWDLELEPNEKKILKYKYEVIVAR